jgi:two-component system, LytTR family, sensor kinase
MLLMRLLRSSGLRLVPVWLAVAVFFSAQNVLVGAARHRPFDWQWDVYHEFVYWLTWAAFTPLVLGAAQRWPLGAGTAWSTVVRHLCLMVLLAPLQITITYTLHYFGLTLADQRPAMTLAIWLTGLESGIVWGTLTGFLYYWLILGIRAAFVYQRMYQQQRLASAELEGRLSEARLEALRLQVHPHFLFNTLNAIAEWCREDGAVAEKAVL